MKLKYEMEIMELGDENVAVPISTGNDVFHGIVKVNDSAAAILGLLKNDISEDEVVAELKKVYDDPHDAIKGMVHRFIMNLINEGLIVI